MGTETLISDVVHLSPPEVNKTNKGYTSEGASAYLSLPNVTGSERAIWYTRGVERAWELT